MDIILEIIKFLSKRKKLWMLPIMMVILFVGALLFLAQGSVLAPFIYTLF